MITFAFLWSSVGAARCCLGKRQGNGMCDDLASKAVNELLVLCEDMLHNPVASIQHGAAPFLQGYFHVCVYCIKVRTQMSRYVACNQNISCVLFSPQWSSEMLSIRAFVLLRPRPQPETD